MEKWSHLWFAGLQTCTLVRKENAPKGKAAIGGQNGRWNIHRRKQFWFGQLKSFFLSSSFFFKFIYFERDRTPAREGQRERENLRQAPRGQCAEPNAELRLPKLWDHDLSQKSRARCLTSWATQTPLNEVFCQEETCSLLIGSSSCKTSHNNILGCRLETGRGGVVKIPGWIEPWCGGKEETLREQC